VRIVVQDVNDHSPMFDRKAYQVSVIENTPVGTEILKALATDEDEGLNSKIRFVSFLTFQVLRDFLF